MKKVQTKKNKQDSQNSISNGGTISQMIMESPLMQQQAQKHQEIFGNAIVQKKENNTGLPDNLKSGMESLSGMSLDDVRVHYNSSKPKAVQAHAFASGNEIHLASGQEKHLPHELGHVVQQAQGRVKPTTSVGGMAVNDNPSLESEATKMGERALQRKIKTTQKFKGAKESKLYALQLSMMDIIQRTKLNELAVSEQNKVNNNKEAFINFFKEKLKDERYTKNVLKIKQLNDIKGVEVKEDIVSIKLDELDLNKIIFKNLIRDFKPPKIEQQIEQIGMTEEEEKLLTNKSAKTPKDKPPIPESISSKGGNVAFKTDIQSGVDGIFDLWYYNNLDILDVDVKFLFKGSPSPDIIESLKETEKFWSNKFKFENTKIDKKIKIDINIILTKDIEDFHYEYQDTTGQDNASVSRVARNFSTRISKDDIGKKQKSTFHEFGHTLGLGEEYEFEEHQKDTGHHLEMITDENEKEAMKKELLGSKEKEKDESTVMAKGEILKPRHYIAILKEFCDLMETPQSDWKIV